jgi:hypothetical protein
MSRPVEGQISRHGKSVYRRGVWRQIVYPPTREELQALMDAPLRMPSRRAVGMTGPIGTRTVGCGYRGGQGHDHRK